MNRFFSSSPLEQGNGIALIRIIVGGFLVYHGWEIVDTAKINEYLHWDMFKNSSSAKTMVYAGKAAELLAGALFFIGLFTRIAAILTIGTLGYIAFFVGHGKIWYEDQYPFLFVVLALVFFFTGPGNLSFDQYLSRKKNI